MSSKNGYAVLLTYALAGLGHLRVTDALKHGIEDDTPTYLYASPEQSLTAIHRLTSIHPVMRAIAEWVQWSPGAEDIFTHFFVGALTSVSGSVYQDILTFLNTNHVQEKTLIVVATHFGLAHQIAAVKQRFLKNGFRIFLVVQVTDDSPQHIWYVPNADLIVVPSLRTKDLLLSFAKAHRMREVDTAVCPYPVSLNLLSG